MGWIEPETEAKAKADRDVWGVVSLAAGLSAAGMVMGPVLTVGFAWMLAVVAVVAGAYSPRGGASTVVGIVLGCLAGLGAASQLIFGASG